MNVFPGKAEKKIKSIRNLVCVAGHVEHAKGEQDVLRSSFFFVRNQLKPALDVCFSYPVLMDVKRGLKTIRDMWVSRPSTLSWDPCFVVGCRFLSVCSLAALSIPEKGLVTAKMHWSALLKLSVAIETTLSCHSRHGRHGNRTYDSGPVVTSLQCHTSRDHVGLLRAHRWNVGTLLRAAEQLEAYLLNAGLRKVR